MVEAGVFDFSRENDSRNSIQGVRKIRKRDGKLVDFDFMRISDAIFKALKAVGREDIQEEKERDLSDRLAKKVVGLVEKKHKVPNVEEVQDCVEEILMQEGLANVAKAYILYREERKKLRDATKTLLDSQEIIRKYIGQNDWRVNENANIDYSHSGLLWHGVGTVMAFYGLNHIYPIEIAKAHTSGDFHLHNLSMPLCGYCAGWSIRQLLLEGFGGVPHKIESSPAKHLRVAMGQIINFIGTLQNEWAGAQAFSSFDTYLAPFVRHDKLGYEEVKQCMQEYVYNMNVTSRWGGQSPFSNITLDLNPPSDLKDKPVIIGGKLQDTTYGDYQKEMDIVNKAFLEVVLKGDASGRVFTWPIPTYNITKNFDWDNEVSNLVFESAAKYGIPYFSNFINSDLDPSDVRSMCCRLRLELKELSRNITGGLFGSGENTGSVGVVTINLAKIGYLAKNDDEFFEKLDQEMYLAMESLEIKRKVVTKNFENWLLPYSKRYLGNLDHHFSTIGIIGMNEACLNFLGDDIASKEGQTFAIRVLGFMRDKIQEFQENSGHIYNLEATPAEGCSYRLAKLDKSNFPNIITSGKDVPYYTNSTQLPVEYTDDVLYSLKHQEPLQTLYTGGTVLHTFLGESITTDAAKLLIKKITSNFRLPYITLTPTFSVCQNHGYLKGKQLLCPTCSKRTEVYSRVVGYIRPVASWNPGKQEEFKHRKTFNYAEFNDSPEIFVQH
jgi:ribonucleoside-triphosphate reductase (formate)